LAKASGDLKLAFWAKGSVSDVLTNISFEVNGNRIQIETRTKQMRDGMFIGLAPLRKPHFAQSQNQKQLYSYLMAGSRVTVFSPSKTSKSTWSLSGSAEAIRALEYCRMKMIPQ
jgi:hypothetical protein